MDDLPSHRRTDRMETLAPGIPIVSKLSLLAGLAGGLFLAIVFSYAAPALVYPGLGIGLVLGGLGALLFAIRSRRNKHHPQ